MNVKVTDDNKFTRLGGCERKKRIKVFQKMENGLDKYVSRD